MIDAGNGTGGMFAPKLWQELGLDVVKLYCQPDGRFPNHLPDPTVLEYVKDLRKRVVAEKADLGIGYDGDSDRIGAVDDKGRVVFADTLLALFSRDVLTRKPGSTIVFDVKCSQALPEEILKYGGRPLMWKTGHSVLKAKMKAVKSPFAGEMSGHMFFADDYYGYDDAIYASGRLMKILAHSDKKFSESVDDIPHFVSTPEIRIECADEEKFKVIDEIARELRSKYETIDVDGARVLFGDGWGLIRASNTQPVLVLRFEARSEAKLKTIVNIFKKELLKHPTVKFTDQDFSF